MHLAISQTPPVISFLGSLEDSIFYSIDPPGVRGGAQKSTVVPVESLLYMLLHTAAADDSSAAIDSGY